jgi:uncharacterized protein YndB with AHSA1/START domain
MSLTNTNEPAKVTLPSDCEIVIERSFRAKKARVFDLWSRPEAIRAWYPCSTITMLVCDVDFRVGGSFRFVTRDDNTGMEFPLSGDYRDIQRPDRIVFTQRFEPFPEGEHIVTLTFSEHAGLTHFTQHILHTSKQNRDGHLKSGFTSGLDDTFARFDQLLVDTAAA